MENAKIQTCVAPNLDTVARVLLIVPHQPKPLQRSQLNSRIQQVVVMVLLAMESARIHRIVVPNLDTVDRDQPIARRKLPHVNRPVWSIQPKSPPGSQRKNQPKSQRQSLVDVEVELSVMAFVPIHPFVALNLDTVALERPTVAPRSPR